MTRRSAAITCAAPWLNCRNRWARQAAVSGMVGTAAGAIHSRWSKGSGAGWGGWPLLLCSGTHGVFHSVVNTGVGQAKSSSTTTMVAAALRSTAQNQQHQQHHHAEWLPKALMSGEDRAVGSVLDHPLLGRSSVGSSSGCCWDRGRSRRV